MTIDPIVRASNAKRRQDCPGSAREERGLPDDSSDLAKKGVLLHSYSQNKSLDRWTLSSQDQDLLRITDEIHDSVFSRVTEQFSIKGEFEEGYEKELWITRDHVPVISGHCDRFRRYPKEKLVVVVENKFGFKVIESAETNLQTRCYSVAAKDEWPTTERVVVALCQPRLSFSDRLTMAVYEAEDIHASRSQLYAILDAASKPDAPLNASEVSCRYCRAKLVCPAFQSAMVVPAIIEPDKVLSKTAREAYLEQKLGELNNEQLEKVVAAVRLAEMIHDQALDEVRRRGGTEHLEVGKESEVRNITDVRKALALLSLSGMDRGDIFDCIKKLSLSDLGDKLRKLHPNWSWQETKDWINKKLSSVIEMETRKGRVVYK